MPNPHLIERLISGSKVSPSRESRFSVVCRYLLPVCLACVTALLTSMVEGYAAFPATEVNEQQGIEFFENRIRPVLVKECYSCHSSGNQGSKGGLVVDTRGGIRAGGDSGPAIVPGNLDKSLLLEAIRYESLEMPPDSRLPDRVIRDFETWVKMGAPDPRDKSYALGAGDHDASQFWAFQPPRRTEPPEAGSDWPLNDIDHYVLARLKSAGRRPVRDADRNSLLRRIYFDLIGLPPSTEQLDAFINDPSPTNQALQRVVDELLDSTHFGERWGRHWLDVARYAESTGMEWNWAHPMAWRFRDYVIQSFNEDKPFDQFVREQIAGDFLPADDDQQRDEQLIATSFLAIGPKAVSIGNDEEFGLELADEQINTISRAFLGLTVGCARCHDHKFDPIPTADYYSLSGIFLSTETLFGTSATGFKGRNNKQGTPLLPIGKDAVRREQVWEEHQNKLAELNKKLSEQQEELKELVDANKTEDAQVAGEVAAGEVAAAKDGDDAADSNATSETEPDGAARIAELETEISDLKKAIEACEKDPPPRPDYTMGVRDREKPIDCEIRIGGERDQRGDEVPRGFLTAVDLSETIELNRDASGRLELANWLAHRDHPLTARVMVNRIWHYLFGRGIVSTVDNFGWLGDRPTHPMLLDHLAIEFMESDWSVKSILRRIVLSRTYRMSTYFDAEQANADPDNLLLWRMRPRRLEAEEIRDAILAISGRLKRRPLGGSPAVAKLNTGWIGNEVGEPEFKNYTHDHRSVYLPIVRDQIPEILQTFDFPNSTEVAGQRDSSMVPAQALYLMNSEFLIGCSQQAAAQLLNRSQLSDWERLDQLYRCVLSRSPKPKELERDRIALEEIRQLLRAEGQEEQSVERMAWGTLFQSLFASGEFLILF